MRSYTHVCVRWSRSPTTFNNSIFMLELRGGDSESPTYRALSQHMPAHISTDEEFLTVRQVASLLNISPRSLRRLLAKRVLASYKLRGSIRISRHDIDSYLEQSRRATAGE